METLGFLATILDAFDDQGMWEALATRTFEFFISTGAQTVYHNVVHPGTQDPRVPRRHRRRSSTSCSPAL